MRDSLSSAGQFRPVSWADFLRYSKALAWMIEEPLMRSQDLLAAMYGYSGRHEIKAILDKPGKPGPFDCDWLSGEDQRPLQPAERSNRVVELIAQCKHLENFEGMSSRWFDTREIGLFEPPHLHRSQFQIVRTKIEILETESAPASSARAAHEYATVGTTISCEDEYLLHFTPLGRSVYDAARDVVARSEWLTGRYDAITIEEKLNSITAQHPNNPWSRAAKVDFFARSVDSDEDKHLLLDDAAISIALFTQLFDGHEKDAADDKLVTWYAETYLWPAVLYWGGILAMECGQLALARRWLNLNKKVAYKDGFGAGRVLREIREVRAGR